MKIDKADLAPRDFTHTLKGFYLSSWRGRTFVKKSPRYALGDNPARRWNLNQFAIAARMAASPIWLDYIGALNASRGTEQVPRDILMMAAYGSLFTLTLPDGTTTTQANHSYVPPAPPEKAESMLIASFYDDAWKISGYLSSGATKGSTIEFSTALTIGRVGIMCSPTTGMTAQLMVCRLSPARVLTEIIAVQSFSGVAAGKQQFSMATNFTVAPGDQITVLLTRTDSTNEYSLELPRGARGDWLYPVKAIETVRLVSNNPVVGSTFLLQVTADVNALAFVATEN